MKYHEVLASLIEHLDSYQDLSCDTQDKVETLMLRLTAELIDEL